MRALIDCLRPGCSRRTFQCGLCWNHYQQDLAAGKQIKVQTLFAMKHNPTSEALIEIEGEYEPMWAPRHDLAIDRLLDSMGS